jgi:endonuclease-3
MSNVKKLKTAERQTIAQNLINAIKKKYKSAVPKHSLNVLDTLIFASILENSTQEEADEAYERLMAAFHDLNEIRVSSVTEIEEALAPLADAGWRALRIREILQHTFEKYYKFDLEELKRKPVEQVEKHISKWKYTTPFMRLFLMQHNMGAHAIPMDDKGRDLLAFLGMIEPQATIDAGAEDLKQVIRKADSQLFCHLIRCVACDPKFKGKLRLTANQALGEGPDATTVVQRMNEVLAGQTPKTPPGPSPAAKAKAEAEIEAAKAASKKAAAASAKAAADKAASDKAAVKAAAVAKSAPTKAAPAKAAPAKAPAVATVKKPEVKKAVSSRSEAAKPKEVVTKKVSKPAPAKKPPRK